jgi:predicted membrane protein
MANEIWMWIIAGLVTILVGVFFAFVFFKIWNIIEKKMLRKKILSQKETFKINGEEIDLKKKLENGKK